MAQVKEREGVGKKGSRFISRAVKTENPVPRFFFFCSETKRKRLLRRLAILPHENFSPVTGINAGLIPGGPDGIVLHCLLYTPHHEHPI